MNKSTNKRSRALKKDAIRGNEEEPYALVRREGDDEGDEVGRLFQRPAKIDFAIGGQAVIEGVMMRSPNFVATSVRKKNGSIKTKHHLFISLTKKFRIARLPIVRGVITLVETMIIGMGAVNFSANEYVDEESNDPPEKKSKIWEIFTLVFSILLSFAFAIFLFKFLPLAITEFLRARFTFIADNYIIFNLIDGLIRIGIFFAYLMILSQFRDFRRIFEYHGAEHMSIFAYEKNLPLTVENVHKQSPRHPRCGTSFLILVLLTSMIVYTFVPRHPEFALNLLRRLTVVPLIAGIGYELLKWSAKFRDHFLVRMIVAPGIWTQYITTRQPNDEQIEVAIKTLETALELEEKRNQK